MSNTNNTHAASGAANNCTILPDGSAFAVASFPLPKDHWLYAPREYDVDAENPKELPSPILTHALRAEVVSAIRYAIRGATMCGKETDFDPDALVQNAVYALCGPYGSAALAAPVQAAALVTPSDDGFMAAVNEMDGLYAAPLAITSAPKRIWLDLGFNPCEDDVHFDNLHDLTWSQNNATGDGIEYVRADLAAGGAAQAAPVDAERLDYLQECGVAVEVLPGRPGWTFRIGGLHGTVHRSVRTAIDAARAAQEGK